jgi:hypothetical protein
MIDDGPEIELTERIESSLIEQLSETFLGVKVPIATLLLYGFIVPIAFRKDTHLPVRVVLRIAQEYLRALHINRHGLPVERFPSSVQQLVRELTEVPS